MNCTLQRTVLRVKVFLVHSLDMIAYVCNVVCAVENGYGSSE